MLLAVMNNAAAFTCCDRTAEVLPAVQRVNRPVLVLNLQPVPQLDYENIGTGEWLANCCACCVPEVSNAFARCRLNFNVVSGQLRDDPRAWGKAGEAGMAERVGEACQNLRSAGTSIGA